MKKTILFLSLIFSFTMVSQNLLNEDFNYTTGSLLTANGWTAHSGSGTQAIDVTTGLVFNDYIASGIGGAANVDNNGEDVNKTFTLQTAGTIYVSFIVQTQATNAAGYFFNLGQAAMGTTFFARVWVNATGTGIGIGNAAPVNLRTITPGTPVLVVAKYDIATKVSSLFVLDTFSDTEPGTPFDSFTESITPTGVGSIALRQYSTSQKIVVDGIRVARSWADAVTRAPITWSGTAWSNTVGPDATKDAFIAGAYSTTANGTFSAKDLTINSGSLTVNSGTNVTVAGKLNNTLAATAVTVENNANILQNGTTNTNVGSITVNRNSASLMRLDYELWGSPVAAQVLQSFSPATLSNRFYTYDNATNTYAATAATGTFTNAAGYLIRMPDTHPTTATVFNGTFTGVPNSGDVSITPVTGFNAIANPYPSTVNMTTFVTDNSGITGTLYFWRKTNSTTVTPGYCSWLNGTYTSNGQPGAITDAAGNDMLQVGQGFIVNSTAGAPIVFKNTQRVANNDNQIFKTTADEKHRVWMNLTSTAGEFSQTAFGYMTNATNGVDALDGLCFNGGSAILATLIGSSTDKYVIQAKALPFTDNDLVPMTFKVTNAGNYTIAIDHVDGLFSAGQEVYLRDALTGTETNLTTGNYTFTTTAGTFDTRFTVAYKSSALATNNAAFAASNVVVYKNNGDIVINTGSNMMSSVKVYDVRGRILVDKTNVNASELRVNVGQINQVVLVQVTSAQGETVTKKAVN